MRQTIHPNQVSAWKQRAMEGIKEVFAKRGGAVSRRARGGDPGPACQDRGADGWSGILLAKGLKVVSRGEAPGYDPARPCQAQLELQCRLLRVSRSSLYHRPKGESAQAAGKTEGEGLARTVSADGVLRVELTVCIGLEVS